MNTTTAARSTVYDVVQFNGQFFAQCTLCGAHSEGFKDDYRAINRGSRHSHTEGLAGIFSGTIR
jgi:hypothetical protein